MKGFRNVVTVFMIVLFMLPTSNASAATFTDVTKYKKEIGYLTDRGILKGYEDGSFKPNNKMNRLNAVQVLLKARGITNFDAPNPNFTDMTPKSHGYAEVAKAVELGIISGKKAKDGSSYFDPKGTLTRGQMAKIIVESMEYPIDSSFKFRDVPKTSSYYNYVSTLAINGITEGYSDRTYRLNLPVSREHFSLFVARMLNDSFKPAPRPPSYLMDTTMDYTRVMKSDGRTITNTLTFFEHEHINNVLSDGWKEKNGSVSDAFYLWEDENGLYRGRKESYYVDLLTYPLYKGKRFEDGWDSWKTIISTDLTLTTKAGTFHNVVVVKGEYGVMTYFAPNHGVIKTTQYGEVLMEVVSITPRR